MHSCFYRSMCEKITVLSQSTGNSFTWCTSCNAITLKPRGHTWDSPQWTAKQLASANSYKNDLHMLEKPLF